MTTILLLALTPTELVVLHHAQIVTLLHPFSPVHSEGRSPVFTRYLESLIDVPYMCTIKNQCMLTLPIRDRWLNLIKKFVLLLPLTTSVCEIQ